MVDAVETQTPGTVPTAPRRRKERTGEVISDKMTKTIVVRVERRFRHPKFKKVVTQYKKFYAHDENREAKVGDRVLIDRGNSSVVKNQNVAADQDRGKERGCRTGGRLVNF